MSARECVTEHLKSENPLMWIGRMDEMQARTREIVGNELIYQ